MRTWGCAAVAILGTLRIVQTARLSLSTEQFVWSITYVVLGAYFALGFVQRLP